MIAAVPPVPVLAGQLAPPTPGQIAAYRRDGCLLFGPLLAAAAVDVLRDELARVVRDHGCADRPQPVLLRNFGGPQDGTRGPGDAELWQIVNICEASPAFAALIRLPGLAEALAALHGVARLRLWHDQVQYKPAGIGGVNRWHQDAPYWRVLTPADAMITAWIALDDADLDNGCMSMVPGSHAWGVRIAELEAMRGFDDLPADPSGDAVRPRPCRVPAGWVHVHHALTWHGSHANTSGRPRRAIAIHYMADGTRFRAAGHHPMKPRIAVADGEPVVGDSFPLVGA